jgi:hypothetical protein
MTACRSLLYVLGLFCRSLLNNDSSNELRVRVLPHTQAGQNEEDLRTKRMREEQF